jgi:hypothetical protein
VYTLYVSSKTNRAGLKINRPACIKKNDLGCSLLNV